MMYRKTLLKTFLLPLLVFGFTGTAFADPTPSCVLTSDKVEVVKGRWIQLSWEVIGTGGHHFQLKGFDSTFPSTQDHIIFTPKKSDTYQLSVINNWGENTCEVYVEVLDLEPVDVIYSPETEKEEVAPKPITTSKILLFGSNGPEVAELQKRLNILQNRNLLEDGIFGPLTKAAVEKFQRENGLKIDGIVGKETWGKLASLAN